MGYFTKEERSIINPPMFWADGVTRHIILTSKEKQVSQNTGKSYFVIYFHEYGCDEMVDERNIRDFAFINALDRYEGEVIEGCTVLAVTPIKTGEREYGGKTYNSFEYSIEPADPEVADKMLQDNIQNNKEIEKAQKEVLEKTADMVVKNRKRIEAEAEAQKEEFEASMPDFLKPTNN